MFDGGDKRTIGSEYTAPNIYAPPGSDAAEARNQDLDAVSLEPSKDDSMVKQPDSGIRPAGAELDEGGIVTADAEIPAETPDEEGEEAESEKALKWYSPERLFKKPGWLEDGPPAQWEPGAE